MEIPYFYEEDITAAEGLINLSAETSNHCVKVLRMQREEEIALTNGRGMLIKALLENADRKRSIAKIISHQQFPKPEKHVSIAISPLKNAGRMEWFLEKATEIGVSTIRLINCARTERSYYKPERFKNILVGAMLQSKQVYLPELHEPEDYSRAISKGVYQQKFIAHCIDEMKTPLSSVNLQQSAQILIGPEGDFTTEEIKMALDTGYVPVELGRNRLRTETAGIVAATLLLLC